MTTTYIVPICFECTSYVPIDHKQTVSRNYAVKKRLCLSGINHINLISIYRQRKREEIVTPCKRPEFRRQRQIGLGSLS